MVDGKFSVVDGRFVDGLEEKRFEWKHFGSGWYRG